MAILLPIARPLRDCAVGIVLGWLAGLVPGDQHFLRISPHFISSKVSFQNCHFPKELVSLDVHWLRKRSLHNLGVDPSAAPAPTYTRFAIRYSKGISDNIRTVSWQPKEKFLCHSRTDAELYAYLAQRSPESKR